MMKADLDLCTDYLLSSCGMATATGLSAMRTQSNHVFMVICAAFKLDCLSLKNKLSHFVMFRKLLIKASQTAYAELQLLRAAAA